MRGDVFTTSDGLLTIEELSQNGVAFNNGGFRHWSAWPRFVRDMNATISFAAKDPCPNATAQSMGSGHVGKAVVDQRLGRSIIQHRCLACGRTYIVDSSD